MGRDSSACSPATRSPGQPTPVDVSTRPGSMGGVSKGPWLDDGEQKAWRSFLLMKRTLETHLERHLQREFGLSGSDFEILVNLSESATGRMRAHQLGRATQWEKSRLSHH